MKREIGFLWAALLFAGGSWALEVRDDLGATVSLPSPAQRIVTLSPHGTELVVAAGAGARLVGISSMDTPPGQLASLPRVGGHGGLDREALLALGPDLVIGWQSGNRSGDLDWIADSGIALYRSEPASLPDIVRTLRDLGALSGTRPEADDAARDLDRAFNTACDRLPRQPAYVQIWARPAMTVGGRHWINSLLEAAGYRNVFAHLHRGVFRISHEAVLSYSQLPQISLQRPQEDAANARLADLMSRPGPGLGGAARLLCARRLQQAPGTGY